jgi:hypothetical protein
VGPVLGGERTGVDAGDWFWGRLMLAVGGGAIPVLSAICGVPALLPVSLRLEPPPFLAGVALGVSPPYFSRSCCVELYFVATLSFSIVSSLCLFSSSRWRCVLEMRCSKNLLDAALIT